MPEFAPAGFVSHDLDPETPAYVLRRVVEIEGLLQSHPALAANADMKARRAEHVYKLEQAKAQLRASSGMGPYAGLKTQAQRDAAVFKETEALRMDREQAQVESDYVRSQIFAVRAEADLLRSRLAGMRTEFRGV